MLGRRRQSVHGGFGQLSPTPKNAGPFTRGLSSSHGRISLSPRTSSTNLAGSSNKLNALAEDPDSPSLPGEHRDAPTNGTNGDSSADIAGPRGSSNVLNGATAEEIFDAPPPSGPPPSHVNQSTAEPLKDQDGFTIPPVANDPISQAQKEAEGETEQEQMFRLNIQNSPIAEEDPDESKAAMSNVANTLSSMQMPSRRAGTVRGRRDVRNTIYIPAPSTMPLPSEGSSLTVAEPTQAMPPSPALHGTSSSVSSSKPSAVQALASEASGTGTSDTQSVRSATSLGGMAHGKHPDLTGPGLNSSIVETVSASFEDSVLKSVKISGEIAFAYNGEAPSPDSKFLVG